MNATSRLLLVTALAFGFASNARADEKKPEKPKPAAESGKPVVIQIDASKLPPDVLRQLLQLAEKPAGEPGKPGTKPAGEKFVKPGEKPGTKPDAKPVKNPGNMPPAKPGAKPANTPDLKPVKNMPPAKPGAKPGNKPDSHDEIIQRLDKLSMQVEQLRRSLQK